MGMIFTDKIEKSGMIFGLIKDRINVCEFKKSLLADDFGLASLPQELWRQRFEMPASSRPILIPSEEPEQAIAGE